MQSEREESSGWDRWRSLRHYDDWTKTAIKSHEIARHWLKRRGAVKREFEFPPKPPTSSDLHPNVNADWESVNKYDLAAFDYSDRLWLDASRRPINRSRYDCSIASLGNICNRRPCIFGCESTTNLGQFGNCLGRLHVTCYCNQGLKYNCGECKSGCDWCMKTSYIFVFDTMEIWEHILRCTFSWDIFLELISFFS